MNKFEMFSNELLLRRLDEIDGELKDFHISAYKSDLIMKERDDIKLELENRCNNEQIER